MESLNAPQIAGLSFPVLRHIPLFAKDELQIRVEISLKYIFQIILDSYDFFFNCIRVIKVYEGLYNWSALSCDLESNEIRMFPNATQ